MIEQEKIKNQIPEDAVGPKNDTTETNPNEDLKQKITNEIKNLKEEFNKVSQKIAETENQLKVYNELKLRLEGAILELNNLLK